MSRAIVPYREPQENNEVLHPEIVNPRIADVEALARWMDYAFVLPGGFRYGLTGFIGLIPGFGDLVDAMVSLYIVWRSVQLGVPRVTLTRMVLNVGIETAMGVVPFLGALFDTVFKANRRNYQLLRNHVNEPGRHTGKDWIFVLAVSLLLAAGVAVPIFLLVKLFQHL